MPKIIEIQARTGNSFKVINDLYKAFKDLQGATEETNNSLVNFASSSVRKLKVAAGDINAQSRAIKQTQVGLRELIETMDLSKEEQLSRAIRHITKQVEKYKQELKEVQHVQNNFTRTISRVGTATEALKGVIENKINEFKTERARLAKLISTLNQDSGINIRASGKYANITESSGNVVKDLERTRELMITNRSLWERQNSTIESTRQLIGQVNQETEVLAAKLEKLKARRDLAKSKWDAATVGDNVTLSDKASAKYKQLNEDVRKAEAGLSKLRTEEQNLRQTMQQQGIVVENLNNQYRALEVSARNLGNQYSVLKSRLENAFKTDNADIMRLNSLKPDMSSYNSQIQAQRNLNNAIGITVVELQRQQTAAVGSAAKMRSLGMSINDISGYAANMTSKIEALNTQLMRIRNSTMGGDSKVIAIQGVLNELSKLNVENTNFGNTIKQIDDIALKINVAKKRQEEYAVALKKVDEEIANTKALSDKMNNTLQQSILAYERLNAVIASSKKGGLPIDENTIATMARYKAEIDSAKKSIADFNKEIQVLNNRKVAINSSSAKNQEFINSLNAAYGAYFKLANESKTTASEMDMMMKSTRATANSMMNIARVSGRAGEGVRLLGSNIRYMLYDVATLHTAFFMLGSMTGIGYAIKVLADFDQSMNRVRALMVGVSGDTAGTRAQFAQLSETVQELGATTKFTSGQVADASKILAQAGLSAAESIKALRPVLDLAVAGNMDMAQSADIVAKSMAMFGLEAENIERITDVYAYASNRAATTTQELYSGMTYAGSVARSFGLSLEETTAILAVMANNGIQASRGGTSLRQMFLNLEAPTARARKTLDAYGLSLQKLQAQGYTKFEAFSYIAKALNDVGKTQNVFVKTALPAAQAFSRNTEEAMKLKKELDGVNGYSHKLAEEGMKSITNQAIAVKSAFEEWIIKTGEVSGITEGLKGMLGGIADFIRGWDTSLSDTIYHIVQVVAIFYTLKKAYSMILPASMGVVANNERLAKSLSQSAVGFQRFIGASMMAAQTTGKFSAGLIMAGRIIGRNFVAALKAASIAARGFMLTVLSAIPQLLALQAIIYAVSAAFEYFGGDTEFEKKMKSKQEAMEAFAQSADEAAKAMEAFQARAMTMTKDELERAIKLGEIDEKEALEIVAEQGKDLRDILEEQLKNTFNSGVMGENGAEVVAEVDDIRKIGPNLIDNILANVEEGNYVEAVAQVENLENLKLFGNVDTKSITDKLKGTINYLRVTQAQLKALNNAKNRGFLDIVDKRTFEKVWSEYADSTYLASNANADFVESLINVEQEIKKMSYMIPLKDFEDWAMAISKTGQTLMDLVSFNQDDRKFEVSSYMTEILDKMKAEAERVAIGTRGIFATPGDSLSKVVSPQNMLKLLKRIEDMKSVIGEVERANNVIEQKSIISALSTANKALFDRKDLEEVRTIFQAAGEEAEKMRDALVSGGNTRVLRDLYNNATLAKYGLEGLQISISDVGEVLYNGKDKESFLKYIESDMDSVIARATVLQDILKEINEDNISDGMKKAKSEEAIKKFARDLKNIINYPALLMENVLGKQSKPRRPDRVNFNYGKEKDYEIPTYQTYLGVAKSTYGMTAQLEMLIAVRGLQKDINALQLESINLDKRRAEAQKAINLITKRNFSEEGDREVYNLAKKYLEDLPEVLKWQKEYNKAKEVELSITRAIKEASVRNEAESRAVDRTARIFDAAGYNQDYIDVMKNLNDEREREIALTNMIESKRLGDKNISDDMIVNYSEELALLKQINNERERQKRISGMRTLGELQIRRSEQTNPYPYWWGENSRYDIKQQMFAYESEQRQRELKELRNQLDRGVAKNTKGEMSDEELSRLYESYRIRREILETTQALEEEELKRANPMWLQGVQNAFHNVSLSVANDAKLMENAVESSVDHMCDALADQLLAWIDRTEFSFRDMVENIRKIWAKMVIDLTVKRALEPVLDAGLSAIMAGLGSLAGSFGGGSKTNSGGGNGGGGGGGSGSGGGGGSRPYLIPTASGAIVDHPSMLYAKHGSRLVGEAGPEAIMPVKRLANGKMGVSMEGVAGGNVITNEQAFTINIAMNGSSGDSNKDANYSKQVAQMVKIAVRSEINDWAMKQSRDGGMFAKRR